MTDRTVLDATVVEPQLAEIREQAPAGRNYESLVIDLRSVLNAMDPKRRQDLTTLSICVLLLNLPADRRAEVLGHFLKAKPAATLRRPY